MLCGLVACAAIPDAIDTDHPDRFRGMIVDSSNPVHTLPDSKRFREAFAKLECLVVIDVAMTETARQAHYVLPASSQYEKPEATFFAGEMPSNYFHIRQPIFEPLGDTLPEAEIYSRLVEAMDGEPDGVEELAEAAKESREAFIETFTPIFRRIQTSAPNYQRRYIVPLDKALARWPSGHHVWLCNASLDAFS